MDIGFTNRASFILAINCSGYRQGCLRNNQAKNGTTAMPNTSQSRVEKKRSACDQAAVQVNV